MAHDISGDDVGLEAHRAAVAHLNACWEALSAEEAGRPDVISPASEPFDGCQDCEVREVLHAAWPILSAAGRDGLS